MGKLYLGTQEICAAYAPNVTIPEAYVPLEVTQQGVLQRPTSYTWSAPSTATSIPNGAFDHLFYKSSNATNGLTSVDFGNIASIGDEALNYCFSQCTNLTTVNAGSITTVGVNSFSFAFYGCSGLTSISFGSLVNVGSKAFRRAFRACTGLTSVSFPALTASSFGSATDQFTDMLYECSGVTVHFPAAIQSTIGSWVSVATGFGGTNTTVLFDL